MAKRPASRAVKKAKRAKKAPGKKVKTAAAKSPSPGKAKAAGKGSVAKKAKPAASRARPAAPAKAIKGKGASPGAAARTRPTASRSAGAAKTAQRAKPSVAAKPKVKIKQSASAKAAKAKAPVSRPRKAKRPPLYLAAELGQPVDHQGEPVGAGSGLVESDTDLQAYALKLWRQIQSGGVVKGYKRAIDRAGLTMDEVWMVGMGPGLSTSSTPDEVRRYHQKLLFRANLLEAILSETVADLHRLPGIEPTPANKGSQSS